MEEQEYYVSYVKDKDGNEWNTHRRFEDALAAYDFAKNYTSEDGTDEIIVYRHLIERIDL